MNIFTIITAIIVVGTVWGGLLVFLIRAMKFEKLKEFDGKS